MKSFLVEKDVYVRDTYACADEKFRLNIRVVSEFPWSNLFAYNMFLRPTNDEIQNFIPDWHIVCVPSFKADPAIDGTRQHNFAVLNFTKKMILIGGTGYTGEIKKGIFSVFNFLLPHVLVNKEIRFISGVNTPEKMCMNYHTCKYTFKNGYGNVKLPNVIR